MNKALPFEEPIRSNDVPFLLLLETLAFLVAVFGGFVLEVEDVLFFNLAPGV